MSCHRSYPSRCVVSVSAAVVLAWGTAAAMSCPIPVFQYALEHWSADSYEVTVYHDGKLSEQARSALATLNAAQAGEKNCANLKLTVHDLSKTDEVERPEGAATLPYMQVRYPRHFRLRDPIWSGPLSPQAVQSLLHSPARDRLASLLLDRKTAVWVFLEGQEQSKNDAAFDLLQKELSRLEKTLVLPGSAAWEGQMVQIYDTIAFDVIRLRRDDPQEQMLIQMLVKSESDLVEFGAVPMVFPVYGRGLVLYALVDKGINRWTVDDAAKFLAGPCSCQIKAGNPGLDLLMSVDWKANVVPLTASTPAAPVGTGQFIRRLEEAQDELDD